MNLLKDLSPEQIKKLQNEIMEDCMTQDYVHYGPEDTAIDIIETLETFDE